MDRTPAAVMRLTFAAPIAVAALLFAAAPGHARPRPPDSQVIEAARAGDAKRLGSLLDQGGSADSADAVGRTALMGAVEGGHREVVTLLIARKADIGRKAKDGSTALSLAIRAGRQDVLTALLKETSKGGFAEYAPGTPLLGWAASLHDAAAVRECIAKSGDDLKRDGGMALVVACGYGAGDVVKILLDAGVPADPDGVDETPLGDAVASPQDGRMAIVRMLLARGAKVDRTNKAGQTPLMMAARAGNVEAIRVLLDAGAKTDLRDNDGQTAAQAAEAEGRGEIVEMLRRHSSGAEGAGSRAELVRAVTAGDAKGLDALLAKGADADARCDDGRTLLMVASGRGDVASARVLLDRGANPNAHGLDYWSRTPLIEAAEAQHPAVVGLLLDRGADANVRMAQGYTALRRAAGDMETVRLLLQHHAEVNARDYKGETALIWASTLGRADVVRLLMGHGANLKRDGGKAVVAAAGGENRSGQVVRLLLARGVPAGSHDRSGETALARAARAGNLDAVKALIARGADVNAAGAANRETPLLMAACWSPRSTATIAALVGAGANVNAADRGGITALMWLASHGNADAVRLLLAKGARISARDNDGRTALKWAVISEQNDTAAILRRAGAKE